VRFCTRGEKVQCTTREKTSMHAMLITLRRLSS
jgi:hypothetical protein